MSHPTISGSSSPANYPAVHNAISAALHDTDVRTEGLDNIPENHFPRRNNGTWVSGNITTDIIVGIPSDYPTLQDAIEGLTHRFLPHGGMVTLLIESGHTITSQLHVYRHDLSDFRIEAEDAVVPVAREALTAPFVTKASDGNNRLALFGAEEAYLPVVGCLFEMDDSGTAGTQDGIRLNNLARALVLPGCGVRAAGGVGCYASHGSTLVARGGVFDDAGDRGIWARWRCTVDFLSGAAKDCGNTCFQMHASHGEAENAILTGAGHYGVRGRRNSMINAQGADFSNAVGHGCNVNEASVVNVSFATGTNAGIHGIQATEGSVVEARATDVSGAAQHGVRSANGAHVDFYQGDASNAGGDGMFVEFGGQIVAVAATGTLSKTANTIDGAGLIVQ